MDRYIYKWVSPRQPLASLLYASFAGNADVEAATRLPVGMVTNNEAGVSISEAFSSNSIGLNGLNTANRTGIISDSVSNAILATASAASFHWRNCPARRHTDNAPLSRDLFCRHPSPHKHQANRFQKKVNYL